MHWRMLIKILLSIQEAAAYIVQGLWGTAIYSWLKHDAWQLTRSINFSIMYKKQRWYIIDE